MYKSLEEICELEQTEGLPVWKIVQLKDCKELGLLERDAFEQKQDKDFWTRQTLCPYTLEELNTLIAQTDSKLEECKVAKAQYSKQL